MGRPQGQQQLKADKSWGEILAAAADHSKGKSEECESCLLTGPVNPVNENPDRLTVDIKTETRVYPEVGAVPQQSHPDEV